jgi:hypothetical protein
MNNKISAAILVVLVVVVGFLGYQNYTLNKKLDVVQAEKDQTLVTQPAVTSSTPDPAAEPGPFSDANKDPLHGKSDLGPAPTTVQFAKTSGWLVRLHRAPLATRPYPGWWNQRGIGTV